MSRHGCEYCSKAALHDTTLLTFSICSLLSCVTDFTVLTCHRYEDVTWLGRSSISSSAQSAYSHDETDGGSSADPFNFLALCRWFRHRVFGPDQSGRSVCAEENVREQRAWPAGVSPRNPDHGECTFLMLQLSACLWKWSERLAWMAATLTTKTSNYNYIVCVCARARVHRGISRAIRTSWATWTRAWRL